MRHSIRSSFYLSAAILCLLPAARAAAAPATCTLVLDLAAGQAGGSAKSTNQVFFSCTSSLPAKQQRLDDAKADVDRHSQDPSASTALAAARKALTDATADLTCDSVRKTLGETQTTDRWISDIGDKVEIFVLYNTAQGEPKVEISEETRSTELASDLGKLGHLILGGAAASGTCDHLSKEYVLTKKRANLSVSASQKLPDATENSAQAKLVTGPVEHWYLSADVPVNKVSQLQLSSDNKTLSLKDSPTTYYIGVDFKLGDLIQENQPLWQNLVLKLQGKFSGHPLDSWGVALGLRGNYLQHFGLSLDQFSPYVGWTSTREDKISGGTPKPGGGRSNKFRVGLSLNLDEALKFAKGATK